MSLRHRRRDDGYTDWRRNCSWNRRLTLGTADDNKNYSYSRPLLPRNKFKYNNHYQRENHNENNWRSENDSKSNVIPKGARGKWRKVAWKLLTHSVGNIKSELINVVTSNLVEFAVAVVTAYVSNWFLG